MKKQNKKRVQLVLHVNPETKLLIEKLAKSDNRSLSNKTEQIINLGLKTDAMVAEAEAVA